MTEQEIMAIMQGLGTIAGNVVKGLNDTTNLQAQHDADLSLQHMKAWVDMEKAQTKLVADNAFTNLKDARTDVTNITKEANLHSINTLELDNLAEEYKTSKGTVWNDEFGSFLAEDLQFSFSTLENIAANTEQTINLANEQRDLNAFINNKIMDVQNLNNLVSSGDIGTSAGTPHIMDKEDFIAYSQTDAGKELFGWDKDTETYDKDWLLSSFLQDQKTVGGIDYGVIPQYSPEELQNVGLEITSSGRTGESLTKAELMWNAQIDLDNAHTKNNPYSGLKISVDSKIDGFELQDAMDLATTFKELDYENALKDGRPGAIAQAVETKLKGDNTRINILYENMGLNSKNRVDGLKDFVGDTKHTKDYNLQNLTDISSLEYSKNLLSGDIDYDEVNRHRNIALMTGPILKNIDIMVSTFVQSESYGGYETSDSGAGQTWVPGQKGQSQTTLNIFGTSFGGDADWEHGTSAHFGQGKYNQLNNAGLDILFNGPGEPGLNGWIRRTDNNNWIVDERVLKEIFSEWDGGVWIGDNDKEQLLRDEFIEQAILFKTLQDFELVDSFKYGANITREQLDKIVQLNRTGIVEDWTREKFLEERDKILKNVEINTSLDAITKPPSLVPPTKPKTKLDKAISKHLDESLGMF